MNLREKHTQKQFALVNQEGNGDFSAQLQDASDLSPWIVTLRGPKNSAYADGTFKLEFSFPHDFPFAPPIISFRTKVYHPNVDSNSGTISWSLTNADWSPAWTMNKVLIGLGNLLSEPDLYAECEIVPEIGIEYREKREVYFQTAKQWTSKYATEEQTISNESRT